MVFEAAHHLHSSWASVLLSQIEMYLVGNGPFNLYFMDFCPCCCHGEDVLKEMCPVTPVTLCKINITIEKHTGFVLKLPIGDISCWCNALSMLAFEHFHAENDKHLWLPHVGKNFLPAGVEKLLKLHVDYHGTLKTPPESHYRGFTAA